MTEDKILVEGKKIHDLVENARDKCENSKDRLEIFVFGLNTTIKSERLDAYMKNLSVTMFESFHNLYQDLVGLNIYPDSTIGMISCMSMSESNEYAKKLKSQLSIVENHIKVLKDRKC